MAIGDETDSVGGESNKCGGAEKIGAVMGNQ